MSDTAQGPGPAETKPWHRAVLEVVANMGPHDRLIVMRPRTYQRDLRQ